VYWFQGHPFQSDKPHDAHPEILRRLCSLYLDKGADVICLQEIQNPEVASQVLECTSMKGTYSPGMMYAQYGALIAARTDWDFENQPTSCSRERSLVVATVSHPEHPCTLNIANIHLPSGRQATSQTPREVREEGIRCFLSLHDDTTDVLVGDLNEEYEFGVSDRLEEAGFVDAAMVAGQEDIPASTKGTGRRDMIWIKSRLKKNLLDYQVLHDHFDIKDISDKLTLSDHFPVMITLKF